MTGERFPIDVAAEEVGLMMRRGGCSALEIADTAIAVYERETARQFAQAERREDATRASGSAGEEALREEVRFLLDRIAELPEATDEEYVREFEGHVRPSLARLAALASTAQREGEKQ